MVEKGRDNSEREREERDRELVRFAERKERFKRIT